MADSLGEGSEGVIFDQALTRSCFIEKSHPFELGVGLGKSMSALCSTSAMSLEINLLQKRGAQSCEKERNFALFCMARMGADLKSTMHVRLN